MIGRRMTDPTVFTSATFESAAASAEEQGRLLLVDFTAAWCAPCKNMDRTTWRDPKVIEWVQQHAIAVQVDVDEEQAIAKRFEVSAMPTLVLLRGEAVLDRVTGARPAPALLEWLEAASNGRKEVDLLLEARDPNDPSTWMALARHLLQAGRFEEAFPHVEELWLRSAEVSPSFGGVRVSFLLALISELVRALPAAKRRFAALRDELEPRLSTDGEAGTDWLALNDALDDEQRSVEWIDRITAAPPGWARSDFRVQDLLVKRERWADLGRILSDPIGRLTSGFRHLDELRDAPIPEEHRAEMRGWLTENCRKEAGILVKALRAAGRMADAEDVERVARERDPSDEMRRALAGEPPER